MADLVENPIRFYVEMNNGILNEIEYYCGVDNPGCYIRVNSQEQQDLRGGPKPKEVPEFQRGEIIHAFESPKPETKIILYAGECQERIIVNILYDKKLKFFKIVCGKNKELMRKVSWEML